MINERLFALKQVLTNKRLKEDILSLKAAKSCYIHFAWDLLEEMQIIKYLSNPQTLNQIAEKAEIKDLKFLETILDFLVGAKHLAHTDNKYFVSQPPKKSIKKDLNYLSEKCPGSTEWTFWLLKKSKETLKSGTKISESGFDSEKGLRLWEQVMNESPYAMRQITISQIEDKLNNKNLIADIGCGGGIGLEDILLRTNNPIKLYGIEVSKKYLLKAKKRVGSLANELTDTKKLNCKKTEFLIHNFVKNKSDLKFDAVFLSLVINHINEKDRYSFFKNISESMKKDSKLVTFQFVNQSKYQRSPMWVMHNIPSHVEFPYKEELITTLHKIFPKVKVLFNGIIIVCEL